jgi:hypothetical protein
MLTDQLHPVPTVMPWFPRNYFQQKLYPLLQLRFNKPFIWRHIEKGINWTEAIDVRINSGDRLRKSRLYRAGNCHQLREFMGHQLWQIVRVHGPLALTDCGCAWATSFDRLSVCMGHQLWQIVRVHGPPDLTNFPCAWATTVDRLCMCMGHYRLQIMYVHGPLASTDYVCAWATSVDILCMCMGN